MEKELTSRTGVASNVAWVSIGNGVTLVIGFASSVLLARWLGVEARGIYALILATALTASAVVGNAAWVQALAFLLGKKCYSPAQIAGHGLAIVMACVVLTVTLLAFTSSPVLESLFPDLTKMHLWIAVFVTMSTLTFGALSGVLFGLDRIPLFTSITVLKTVVALLLQIILLGVLSMGLQGALWELILSGSVVLVIAAALFLSRTGIDLRLQARSLRDIFAYAGKSYPGHLGVMLLSRVDIYFVALFGGARSAGLYAVAKGLAEIVAIIEQSISQAVTPQVITSDRDSAADIVSRAFRASFWLNGLVLIIAGLLARRLVPLIYGPEYTEAARAFLLLSPGVLLLTTRTLGTFFSMQLGRPEITTYYVLASGLVSLPISFFLTRRFGYSGAAAAFSIVAVLRGVTAMILFMAFSHAKVRHVLLPTKADVSWLPQVILSRLRTHISLKQKVKV